MSDNPLLDIDRDSVPPEALRERVTASLRRSGLIESRRAAWRPAMLAAGLVFMAALGYAGGRRIAAPPLDASPRYLLMLREDSTYRDDRPVASIVSEYARWADSLRQHGLLVLGEKLADERLDLTAANAAASRTYESPVTGLFIIRAPNLEGATAVARSSPHLRYGGRIVLRPIENTSGAR